MFYRQHVFVRWVSVLAVTLGLLVPPGLWAAPVINLPQDIEDIQAQLQALGAPPAGVRYVNNGDGTITDFQTGLMWEVKDDSGSLHDKDDIYTWTAGTTAADGTLFTVFLAGVNTNQHDTATDTGSLVSFAGGYADWRVPTNVELQTILDVTQGNCGGGSGPCVDAIFDTNCTAGCSSTALDPTNACSCTAASLYWSSTSNASNPNGAWLVDFSSGSVNVVVGKTDVFHVRAVRGGR